MKTDFNFYRFLKIFPPGLVGKILKKKKIFFDYIMNYQNNMSIRQRGIEKAQIETIAKYYKAYYSLAIENGNSELLPPDMKELIKLHNDTKLLEKDRENDNVKVWMLTINPPNPYDWSHLIQVVDKILTFKNVIIDPEVQLEQRSDDEEFPFGYHVHIACKIGKSSKGVIDDCYRALSKFCPNATRNCIDLKRSPKAYEYIAGDKVPEKMLKVRVDQILRNNFFANVIKPEWLTKMDCSQDMQEQDGKDLM